MKPILLIVAACAALLCALPAEAKLFHRHAADVRVAVSVTPQTQAIVQPQEVRYVQGERRLRLGERIKARLAANKAIRELRVPTVVEQHRTLGIKSEGSAG